MAIRSGSYRVPGLFPYRDQSAFRAAASGISTGNYSSDYDAAGARSALFMAMWLWGKRVCPIPRLAPVANHASSSVAAASRYTHSGFLLSGAVGAGCLWDTAAGL